MANPTSDSPMASPAEQINPPIQRGRRFGSPSYPSFKRVFDEKDEIRLLKALSEFTESTKSSIIPSPKQFDSPRVNGFFKHLLSRYYNRQLSDKLRRLRRRYERQARKMIYMGPLKMTPHDRELFEISRQIWGKNEKKGGGGHHSEEEDDEKNGGDDEDSGEEDDETLEDKEEVSEKDDEEEEEEDAEVSEDRSAEEIKGEIDYEKLPFLVEEFERCFLEKRVLWREGLSRLEAKKLRDWNEKWKQLQIEEAMVMTKRSEMVQEQMRELLGLLLKKVLIFGFAFIFSVMGISQFSPLPNVLWLLFGFDVTLSLVHSFWTNWSMELRN